MNKRNKGEVAEILDKLGISGMTEVSEKTSVSFQTLYNWYKYKPVLFKTVLLGLTASPRSIKAKIIMEEL